MKTFLITFSVIAVFAALVYLIVKANKREPASIVEVTTPPATVVQPVYVVRRSGNGHSHNGNGNVIQGGNGGNGI